MDTPTSAGGSLMIIFLLFMSAISFGCFFYGLVVAGSSVWQRHRQRSRIGQWVLGERTTFPMQEFLSFAKNWPEELRKDRSLALYMDYSDRFFDVRISDRSKFPIFLDINFSCLPLFSSSLGRCREALNWEP